MVIATRMERMSRDAEKRRSRLASAVALLLSTEKQTSSVASLLFWLVKIMKRLCRKEKLDASCKKKWKTSPRKKKEKEYVSM